MAVPCCNIAPAPCDLWARAEESVKVVWRADRYPVRTVVHRTKVLQYCSTVDAPASACICSCTVRSTVVGFPTAGPRWPVKNMTDHGGRAKGNVSVTDRELQAARKRRLRSVWRCRVSEDQCPKSAHRMSPRANQSGRRMTPATRYSVVSLRCEVGCVGTRSSSELIKFLRCPG